KSAVSPDKWRRPAVRDAPPASGVRVDPKNVKGDGPEHIIFRFGIVDPDGPFGWRNCTMDHVWPHIKHAVSALETMTWAELQRSGKHHELSAHKLSKEAHKRLSELDQDDAADTLYSMHVTGKMRIIGIRDRRYFKVLWWDPEHEVSPSNW